MAELLGVVASGISIVTIAAQISSSVIKLKSYYDELNEAPEEIRSLIERVEILSMLLTQIRDDQGGNSLPSGTLDASSASRCLENCLTGADRLKELVDDLGAEVALSKGLKKKWIGFKVLLRKTKIDKFKNRLEGAIVLLNLSYQCYMSALIRQQPDVIISQLTFMNSPVQTTCTTPSPAVSLPLKESLSIEAHGSQDEREWLTTAQPRRRKQQKEVITPHHVLKSIFKWAWDIEVSRSHSGWRVNLRTYNLIPHHSPAHEAIIEGNVQRLQELLGKGLASPFDVVVENKYRGAFLLHVTLLELAAGYGHLSICRLLLENGAEPDVGGRRYSPINTLVLTGFQTCPRKDDPVEIARLLLDVYEVELSFIELREYRGPKEGFVALLERLNVPYYKKSLEMCFNVAYHLIGQNHRSGGYIAVNTSPALFRAVLHPESITDSMIEYRSSEGSTLLHLVAYAMNACYVSYRYKERDRTQRRTELKNDFLGWRTLLREFVRRGAELHHRNNGKFPYSFGTPLLSLLSKRSYLKTRYFRIAQELLHYWLEDLEVSGVDLLHYGRIEKKELNHFRYLNYYLAGEMSPEELPFYISERFGIPMMYTFGSSPSDWRLWSIESSEHFAGEFWSLVESPPLLMPGTWID